MEYIMALVLAAGEGKRMKSKTSKVCHKACGKALIEWVYDALCDSGINDITLVVGHKEEQVRECLKDKVKYAVQKEQLGTGHAVMQAQSFFSKKDGNIFILCGDAPLVTSETISNVLKFHKQNKNSVTVISADLEDPSGYGRIVRNREGDVLKIVEHNDATFEEKNIKEINSGMYCFSIKCLEEALLELNKNNSQGEYYLTDTLEILIKKGKKVGAIKVADNTEILGINDRIQLNQATNILRQRILKEHMKNGVTIIDQGSVFIDKNVEIGMDTIIYPSTIIEAGTKIGKSCIIGPGSRIVNSSVLDGAKIVNSVVFDSIVGEASTVGPFAYIRPESVIGKKVKVGDFVEIKKSIIGDGTKISHLTYVGDAEVGSGVNLGCGVVVVNYDGKEKNKTIIRDNAFVGCNVNLISPVEVKKNSYVAAGSTITKDVPENSLAIARSRQTIKEDWVVRKENKK